MKNIIFIAIVFTVYSCKKEEINTFRGCDAVAFVNRTEQFSFIGNPDAKKTTLKIPLRVIGLSRNYERKANVEVIHDSFTTAPPEHYKILDATVEANQYGGILYIDLYNSPELTNNIDSLNLKIGYSKDFQPGNKENNQILVSWTAKIIQPKTWNAMRSFFCARYSTNVYRAIIASCNITEFWYFQAGPDGTRVSQKEGYVLAKKFGDWVRAYNKAHPNAPYTHDDGPYKGQEIIPIH